VDDKVNENWEVGCACLKAGNINAAANRIYYATFQAVLAYFRTKSSFEEPNGSIHSYITRELNSLGGKNVNDSRNLRLLKELRETADYQPDTPDKDELNHLLPIAEKMKTHYLNKCKQ